MKVVFSFAVCLAVANAAGLKAEVFPSLRKRMHEHKLAATQVSARVPAAPAAVEEKEGPEPVSAVVPAPLDAGADGFPELPSVSTMLGAASGTLKTVNNQASSLEARVVAAQMQSESKMAKQKAAFEEKLKQQEQGNQNVITANANISAQIKVLKSANAALRKNAHEIGENNKLMRSELKTLQARLGVAKDFTGKSLTSTDDSKSSLLQVLKGKSGHKKHAAFVETGSKSTHDDDEDDEDDDDSTSDKADDDKEDDDQDDDEEGAASFLAISMKKRRTQDASLEAELSDLESAVPTVADVQVGPAMPDAPADSPGDLLAVLSKQVSNLANQEKESEKNLKNLFIRDFRAGAKRHQALMAQQKSLTATRIALQTLKSKLETAVAHLSATQSQLEGRLHGIGQYLQKLAHFAMAPQSEANHLLDVLPKTVTVKAL